MVVTDIAEQTLGQYESIFIDPLLKEKGDLPYRISIRADGLGSPEVGEILKEPDKEVGFKVRLIQSAPNGSLVVAVYKPGKPKSYRNSPQHSFIRSLEEQINEHIESQGKYKEKGLGILDVPFSELPPSENGSYVEYNGELNPGKFGFAKVSADESGIYTIQEQFPTPYDREVSDDNSKEELEELQARVIRYVTDVKFEEELTKAERQRDYNIMMEVVRRVPRRSITSAIKELDPGKYLLDPNACQITDTHVTEEGVVIKVESEVAMLTGRHRVYGQVNRHDARCMADLLSRLNVVSFDSVDGLYLKRVGYPTIRAAPDGSEAAKSGYSHIVGAKFVTEFSSELLPEIYENNKILVTS